jgi:hypothetical protein
MVACTVACCALYVPDSGAGTFPSCHIMTKCLRHGTRLPAAQGTFVKLHKAATYADDMTHSSTTDCCVVHQVLNAADEVLQL